MLGGPGVSRSAVSCLSQPQPRVSFVRAPLNPVGSNTAISAAGPGGRTKQQGGQREGKHHSAQQVAFMWSSIRPCIERLTCHGTHALHMGPQCHRGWQTACCLALMAEAYLCASIECRCHNTWEFSRQPATPQATRPACCKARHSSSCRPTCSSRHGWARQWLLPVFQVSLYCLWAGAFGVLSLREHTASPAASGMSMTRTGCLMDQYCM